MKCRDRALVKLYAMGYITNEELIHKHSERLKYVTQKEYLTILCFDGFSLSYNNRDGSVETLIFDEEKEYGK